MIYLKWKQLIQTPPPMPLSRTWVGGLQKINTSANKSITKKYIDENQQS
jgi:hypothetical protein